MGIKHSVSKTSMQRGYASEWNADHIIDSNVDCDQNQHLSHVIENRTDWPAGPVEGQIICRTDQHTLYYWSGTAWVALQSPATIIVAADGSGQYTDIQDGIDALPAIGGVVYIKEGTYTLTAALSITSDNVALVGAGRSTEVTTAAGINLLEVNGFDFLFISQIYFDGQDVSLDGLQILSTNETTITNCWIEDCGADGINMQTSSNCIITECIVRSCLSDGIFISNCDNANVLNNLVSDNGATGMFITSTGLNYNISVVGNQVEDNASAGIYINALNESIVNNNIVKSNGIQGIRLTGCSDMTCNSNNCITNTRSGIWLNASGWTVVSGNVSSRNVRHGISVDSSSECTVSGNFCEGNDSGNTATYDGIYVSLGDNNIITSNRCMDNDRYEINIAAAGATKNIVVANHCLGADHVGAINDAGVGTEVAHNIIA